MQKLKDVDPTTNPTDGQALLWDNANGYYKPGTISTSSALATLTDVNLTGLSDQQIIKYDAASSKWINATNSGGSGGAVNYFSI